MQTKTIFITGASTGFGRIAADILHKKGHTVYGTSRTPSKYDTDFNLVKMDVTNNESVAKAISSVIEKVGNIDVLINNAGRAMYGAIEEASENNIQELFETNVFGLMRVTAKILPVMRKQRSGRIINITSLAGIAPTPTIGIYSATKHAVEGYSKCLKFELEQFGIDVVMVKPGEFMTDVFANAIESDLKIDDYSKFRDLIDKQMQARNPEDLAPAEEVGQLIANLVNVENPALDNLIGEYSDLILELMSRPEEMHEVCRQVYQLHELNAEIELSN